MDFDSSSVLHELTLEEKIRLVHGTADPDGTATGYVPGVERVGIPELKLVDGPLGVRAMGENATAFPASISLAASWDPNLGRTFGRALGRETKAHDQDVILGPGVNIIRTPHGGRNFEYYSEDPYLSARMGVGTIEGIQSAGVAATVKHFVANNQETNRYEVSASVSERALREIYLPAFRAAVEEANVLSVMTAYNRVNGVHMSDHEYLLSDVLKGEWDFDGLVVSDWWGTRSTIDAAHAGLDLEMPGVEIEEFLPADADIDLDDSEGISEMPALPDTPALFGEPLRTAIASGELDEQILTAKITRLLTLIESIDRSASDDWDREAALSDHRDLGRTIAVEGTVLLRNDGTLPIDPSDSLAVIGPNADAPKLGGGGSSEVTPMSSTSPLEGIQARSADVSFERGVSPIDESSFFSANEDRPDDDATSIDAAVSAAESVDCAVIIAQDDATEFKDRSALELPNKQNELISTVAAVAERTVVVLRTSGPVELPWIDDVDAVLQTWYPGAADGVALADVLFGEESPGGRLPVTFGHGPAEYPTATPESFPGVDDVAAYDEGIFVGYRYFDEHDIEPAFPFGHGLSYTTFEYGDVTVTNTEDSIDVSVDVRNTGGRSGKEVVQLYAQKSAPVPTPDRELVGFETVTLEAGESATTLISLDIDSFSFYDGDSGWTLADDHATVLVGRSSRDIRASIDVDISGLHSS